ncbi:unnamed protein product, partial [Lymnaea stagnalis]
MFTSILTSNGRCLYICMYIPRARVTVRRTIGSRLERKTSEAHTIYFRRLKFSPQNCTVLINNIDSFIQRSHLKKHLTAYIPHRISPSTDLFYTLYLHIVW